MKACLFAWLCSYALCAAQSTGLGVVQPTLEELVLSRRIPQFTLLQGTLYDGVKKLSSGPAPFAFGFEEVLKERFSDPDIQNPRFDLRLENKTVRDILDALSASDSRTPGLLKRSLSYLSAGNGHRCRVPSEQKTPEARTCRHNGYRPRLASDCPSASSPSRAGRTRPNGGRFLVSAATVARLVSGPECTPSHESPGRPYGTACVLDISRFAGLQGIYVLQDWLL